MGGEIIISKINKIVDGFTRDVYEANMRDSSLNASISCAYKNNNNNSNNGELISMKVSFIMSGSSSGTGPEVFTWGREVAFPAESLQKFCHIILNIFNICFNERKQSALLKVKEGSLTRYQISAEAYKKLYAFMEKEKQESITKNNMDNEVFNNFDDSDEVVLACHEEDPVLNTSVLYLKQLSAFVRALPYRSFSSGREYSCKVSIVSPKSYKDFIETHNGSNELIYKIKIHSDAYTNDDNLVMFASIGDFPSILEEVKENILAWDGIEHLNNFMHESDYY